MSSSSLQGSGSGDVRALQEALHVLLSRLAATQEHVQNWPSEQSPAAAGGSSSITSTENIHVSSTTKLIQHLNQVLTALRGVEDTVRKDAALRKALVECPIPVDLLDLLDSSRLNPDVFSRGLLREALGQLAGLRRRKLALEMLGAAIQSGINRRKNSRAAAEVGDANPANPAAASSSSSSSMSDSAKEAGVTVTTASKGTEQVVREDESESPAMKKQRVEWT
jgi:hypothetical protein